MRTAMGHKATYVLDADIEKGFARLDQTALLAKGKPSPPLRRQLQAWLQAGAVDQGRGFPTEAGTMPGSPLSPLLANIALHGLEAHIHQRFPRSGSRGFPSPNVVVYADDLVRLQEDHPGVQRCQGEGTTWLHTMGLTVKPSKTRITHPLDRGPEKPGWDFLGFHIQHYRAGKTMSGKDCRGRLQGFTTQITPSPTAIQRQVDARRKTLARHKHAEQERLMQARNPQIRGWSQDYAPVRSARLFQPLDHTLYGMLWGGAVHRHPNTAKHRIARPYWRVDDGQGWTFQPPNSRIRLLRHAHTPHRRYGKVQGTRSPDAGDWVYWSTRWGRHPEGKPQVARLRKQQQGKCRACGLPVTEEDPLEIAHILPKGQGGKETRDNLQLLPRPCHARKTTQEQGRHGTYDRRHGAEEPDDAKASRPVLQPSRGGDTPA